MRSLLIDSGEVSGYPYAIVLQPLGHLCGYIALGRGHPWYGADRDDAALTAVRVHGGITYAAQTAIDGFPRANTADDAWWIGFDLARTGAYERGGRGSYPHPEVVDDDRFAQERQVALSELADLVRQAAGAERWQSLSGL